jgi:outer membrane protein assembly factor BamE (lipoprotein component of BamABCDE complex)
VVNQDIVAIVFDDVGTVSRVDRHGLDRAQEVSLVDRETPTAGSELTVLEQFIGNIGRFNPPADADTR